MRKILLLLSCSLFLLSGVLQAQTRTLTGKVTDASGNPVPNASVVVKGTKVGTVTNTDGMYSINVPANAKSLVISSVNMQSEEIPISSGMVYNFTLKALDASMQEVVVVGYTTILKRSLTGSVSKVAGEAMANKPVLSFDQALTGKAAGVQVNTASGLVGDNVTIRIRGAASITSGAQPLIVLDGIPITQGDLGQLYNPANGLADLNPNDIESVEVLKDASAVSIYGSRGSAGVLLITTKKGKAGQSTLNYDTYVGFNEPSRKIKVLNAADYTTTINKLRSNAGLSVVAKYGDIDNDGKLDTMDTDWQDAVYRKGLVQNHQLALSGGSQRTTYYTSLNYNDYQNYIDVNRQKRGSVRLNLNSKLNDWLTVGVNSQFSRTKSYGLGTGVGALLSGIPLGPLLAAPNIPVYGSDGDYYLGRGGNTIGSNIPNPKAVTNLNYDNRDSRRFIGSAFGEVQLIKGLKFKSQVNLDYLTAFNDNYWNPDVGDGLGFGLGQTVHSEINTWTWFNTLNYNTVIANDHELNALAGAEYSRNTGMYAYNRGVGIVDPQFKIINAANYDEIAAENGIAIDNGLASYFGGINYGYKKKYLATFNFRADADSRFGKDNRWGYFPSGSVAWRLTEEDFMQQFKFVNDLKLRTSYGVTGNSDIGYFPSISTYEPDTYADLAILTLSNPGNSQLRWERHKQFDIGIDAVLWGKTNVTLEYYNRKTIDLILKAPVLATLGFPGNIITENIGSLRNQGVELTVSTPVWRTKTFNWMVNFNMAWNKNIVLSTNTNGDQIFDTETDENAIYSVAKPGEQLGAFYLIRWAGVNPANGLPMFLDMNGDQKQYDHATKTWSYLKDGTTASPISATDRVLLTGKTPYPKIYGGMTQNFTFMSFDAAIDLQYAFGFYVYDQTMSGLFNYGNVRNKSVDILEAWTTPGQKTDVPRLYYTDNFWTSSTSPSTRWLEKGDFVRIRNVQIGYTLPKSISDRVKLSRLRFYIQGQNLYTFTGYEGTDPEANGFGHTNIALGVDRYRPYLARTYTVGINLSL
jgi:TonB-dependent starch-binding outer membrane protein SusC